MQTPGHKLCKWLTGGIVNAHRKLSVGFSVISGKHDNTSTSYSETKLFLCSSTGTNIEFYSTVLFPDCQYNTNILAQLSIAGHTCKIL